MKIFLKAASSLKGEAVILGDKSIAHRAVILSALARGKTVIKNFPPNDDCSATVNVFKKLGVKIISRPKEAVVFGVGLRGLKKPAKPVFVDNSGTTLRIVLGVLAGQDFKVVLTAARGLSKRPMARVILPLRRMGAQIKGRQALRDEYPPLVIHGGNLKAVTYKMPMASAQVKSAILLAGLYASGRTAVIEKLKTRDHTERMLKIFGADIRPVGNKISITGKGDLVSPREIRVPGDISSAAFFLVLGAICPKARIILKNISLNPRRAGVLRALEQMQADIFIQENKSPSKFEPMGDIIVKSSKLKRIIVKKEQVPALIDELPVLMVAACFAQGVSRFEAVEELRVKETDRIKSMQYNLSKMGADIQVFSGSGNQQNVVIRGTGGLSGAKVKSFGDHRTAMSMVVAGLAARGSTQIDDITCINKSFPGFMEVIKDLRRRGRFS